MDDEEQPPFRGDPRQPDSEGVRIIGAEEAEKAIEREDVAHRLPTDAPRFGDRPVSPPEDGPRPAIRFPLAGSSDPRDVERTPVVPADPPSMPHWTEPATGEVPSIFAADTGSGTPGEGDDLEAWSSFTSSQPRWRGEGGASEQDDYDDFSRLADDDTRIGALDTSDRPAPDDFFEFEDPYDEPPIDPEPETRSISSDPRRTAARTRSSGSAYDRPADGGRDVQTAAAVGAGIAAAYLLLSSLGSQAVMVLVVAVVGFAVAELFTALRKGGYHPATLLGIVASVTLPIAAYSKLEAAYPVVLFMTVVFCLIWYLIGAGGDDSPVLGTASTLLGVGYVGVLGSFAALILALPNEQGVGVLFGAVFATVGYDVGGFFVGRSLGQRPLSAASPNKTVEGLLGGAAGAIIMGGIIAGFIGPWSDKGLGVHLLFGVCAAVAAFLGDLCESLLKRDLGVKDMGTILPGHGGVLDPRRAFGAGLRPARNEFGGRPAEPVIRGRGLRRSLCPRTPAVRERRYPLGMRSVAVLGATGSIGTQTLDVIRAEAGAYDVVALGAASSVELLAEQAREFRPQVVAIADDTKAKELESLVPAGTTVVGGPDALAEISTDADVVVNGVVGFAGLSVTLAALGAGRRLALANKESLIAAGPVVQKARLTPGAELVPVDSEHCAVHQCLRANNGGDPSRLARIVLTASGGPFRGRSSDELRSVTVEEALAHPTWSMGPKITVDSSTLMNKGLEVIEAHELFGADYDHIEVVVHPQSIIHSMVEFTDGATIAQLSLPDMRLPIGYALAYPDRITTPFGRIDWADLRRLDFEAPDLEAFPCLALAYEAGRRGETAPAWLNAANEVAVAAFLDGLIPWIAIADVLKAVLDRHDGTKAESADVVIEIDRLARVEARRTIEQRIAA